MPCRRPHSTGRDLRRTSRTCRGINRGVGGQHKSGAGYCRAAFHFCRWVQVRESIQIGAQVPKSAVCVKVGYPLWTRTRVPLITSLRSMRLVLESTTLVSPDCDKCDVGPPRAALLSVVFRMLSDPQPAFPLLPHPSKLEDQEHIS
jgi:hypothetical protein